jgi:hypothetical protein
MNAITTKDGVGVELRDGRRGVAVPWGGRGASI